MSQNSEYNFIIDELISSGLIRDKLNSLDAGQSKCCIKIPFLSWHPEDTVRLKPEFAALSIDGVPFLQLPALIDQINDALDKLIAIQQSDKWSTLRKLLIPSNQLVWSLSELKTDLNRNDLGTAKARLNEIKRFSSQNYPGWFENVIEQINESITRQEIRGTDRLINLVVDSSGIVDFLTKLSPLLHGQKENVVGSVSACVTVIEYHFAPDFTLGIETVISSIKDKDWWNPLRQTMDSAMSNIKRIDLENSQVSKLSDKLVQASSALEGVTVVIDKIFIDDYSPNSDELKQSRDNMRVLLGFISDLTLINDNLKSVLGVSGE